jgi:hypothetical protein
MQAESTLAVDTPELKALMSMCQVRGGIRQFSIHESSSHQLNLYGFLAPGSVPSARVLSSGKMYTFRIPE